MRQADGAADVRPDQMALLQHRSVEQAGYSEPPKTWDELFEMGQNMVSKGLCKYPIAWAAKQARVWYATGLYASPLPAAPCGMTMATGIQ